MRVARDFAKAGEGLDLHRFPECLSNRKWANGRGFLGDLARLEIMLRLAILAPDVESSGFENVAMASEPEWYKARFRFDPALKILESEWPLDQIYSQPQGEFKPEATTLLIYRSSGKAQFRALDSNESLLIQSLSLGVPLGHILERKYGPDFDAMTFHRWMESGVLRAIDWAPV